MTVGAHQRCLQSPQPIGRPLGKVNTMLRARRSSASKVVVVIAFAAAQSLGSPVSAESQDSIRIRRLPSRTTVPTGRPFGDYVVTAGGHYRDNSGERLLGLRPEQRWQGILLSGASVGLIALKVPPNGHVVLPLRLNGSENGRVLGTTPWWTFDGYETRTGLYLEAENSRMCELAAKQQGLTCLLDIEATPRDAPLSGRDGLYGITWQPIAYDSRGSMVAPQTPVVGNAALISIDDSLFISLAVAATNAPREVQPTPRFFRGHVNAEGRFALKFTGVYQDLGTVTETFEGRVTSGRIEGTLEWRFARAGGPLLRGQLQGVRK
jgi:hypothetical protein